jgi:predicted metal-binding membrane protein
MEVSQKLPRRDFLAIIFSLGGVTILCWLYLILMARNMSMPAHMDIAALQIKQWSAGYFRMMLSMWVIMMVGMMLPSAAPIILIYAAVARKSEKQGMPVASSGVFALGYIVIWVIFSLLATIAQWGLDQVALLSPMMVANSPLLGASLLFAAGIYQWLPVKNACLQHCRSPFHFISSHWSPGSMGAFKMGLSHGAFCLGCCWVLMLLLFVCGVMNLVWIAAITVFVLLEKVLPLGDVGGRVIGILMIIIGGIIAFIGI